MTHRNLTAWRHVRLFLSFGLLAGALPLACGSEPALDFSPGDVGRSCDGNDDCNGDLVCSAGACSIPCGSDAKNCTAPQVCLGDVCSIGIGSSCKDSDDCKGELVCSSAGHCAVACEAGKTSDKCGGKECRADGTCPIDGGLDIGDGEGGAGGQSNGGENCIDVDVEFTPQIPTVLLLIDRSGSMNAGGGFGSAVADAVDAGEYELGDCPSNNDWRWNVVRDVLLNPEKGIVKPLESRVRFGLSLYTSLDGDRSSSNPNQIDPSKECPMLEEVDYGLDNHASMLEAFRCSDFPGSGDTPTGPALLATAASLSAFDEPGPKVIVLATDGEPDDCECPDFSGSHVPTQCRGGNAAAAMQRVKDDVVEFAGQIHEDDIVIHVINVSSPGNASLQTHLADVAEAGGGNVYPGFNPGELASAFDQIIYGARSCKIDLDGSIAAGKESTGTVRLDGTRLELGDPDGYRVNDPKQIELRGAACDAIKSGDHDLTIKFPCESFVPVPR